MIPTMMASTPSRINEVDDDLSTDVGRGVDVDVDMAGGPFVRLGFPSVCAGCVAADFGPRVHREWSPEWPPSASIAGLAHARKGAKAIQPVGSGGRDTSGFRAGK